MASSSSNGVVEGNNAAAPLPVPHLDKIDAHVPLMVCQIERSFSGDHRHVLNGVARVPKVEVCGIVVYKKEKFASGDIPYTKYGIDDGTGMLECMAWTYDKSSGRRHPFP